MKQADLTKQFLSEYAASRVVRYFHPRDILFGTLTIYFCLVSVSIGVCVWNLMLYNY